MKIAVFYNLAFGGAKRTVQEHVKGLTSLGNTVDVYTIDESHDIFDPGLFCDCEHRYSYKPSIISLPFIKRLSHDMCTFYLLPQLHKQIAADIDCQKYDIVLVHTDTYTQSPFILRYLKTKNVYFCLEPLRMVYEYGLRIPENISPIHKLYESWNRYMRKNIDRQNSLAANYTLAISYFGRECMMYAYDLFPKISYLGVDEKVFKPMKIKKKNQVLFIGQKLPINGYEYAVKAIESIPKSIRPELKVVTLPKTKEERLPDNDIAKLYNESLLTLSLSTYDTFGLIPLESMACEVPVIAFNVAGYRETMKDCVTGYLTDFSSKEVAERIIELLNNPEKAAKMGKEGRAHIEKQWTWEYQVKKLEAMLQDIAKQ
jgi:glycosyltransferase involved in cell wall biosynthesis